MRRRQFFRLPWAVPTLVAGSLSGPLEAATEEVFVRAGADRDGKPFEILGATFQVKVSGKDTEGRCVIFDTTRHQKLGPALHLHTDCDEWFFVKDGEFKVQAGERILRLKMNDSLLVPRGMPHSFVKTSDGDARLIVMHQPAVKMEEFFRLISQQSDQAGAMNRLASQYGFRILGPPLSPD